VKVKYRRMITGACALLLAARAGAQVSLYTAVDLSLRNSTSVRIATADVQRAAAALTESKDVYVPSFVVGSGLGYSYGFPVGQPSVYNVTSQSLLLGFSQPDYIRSARAAVEAGQSALKDARQQVILDTALGYIELDKLTQESAALEAQNAAAEKLVKIEQERLDAGLTSRSEILRAQLTGAQVRLKRLHLQDQQEVLREKLAHLTGLPVSSFVTDAQTIPPPPTFDLKNEIQHDMVVSNEGVRAAYASAKSKLYVAFGDQRQNYRPQITFAAQYNRFAKFNNYQDYYNHFQHNNFGIGIQVTFPIFDASRKAKAKESSAEAAHAAAQADQARDQASEQTTQLQKSLRELIAQQEVAELQSELAANELESVVTQLQSGSGSANAPQLTPRDEQNARIQERQRYQELLDAKFELLRAELSLLRMTGTIEDWAKSSPHP
jgi:outer membrane protein TolC